jgi:hypothetical protein
MYLYEACNQLHSRVCLKLLIVSQLFKKFPGIVRSGKVTPNLQVREPSIISSVTKNDTSENIITEFENVRFMVTVERNSFLLSSQTSLLITLAVGGNYS